MENGCVYLTGQNPVGGWLGPELLGGKMENGGVYLAGENPAGRFPIFHFPFSIFHLWGEGSLGRRFQTPPPCDIYTFVIFLSEMHTF